MSLASRSRLIAAALMIGAIAAPVASAQFVVAPAGTPSGAAHLHGDHAQNPGGYICGTNYSMNSVDGKYCRPRQAAQLALSAAVPPILPRARASEQAAINRAQAREAQALSYSLPPGAQYRMEELNANASAVHPVAATTPTDKAPGGGFDWGDAGIGAAGGLALAMLGLAGALTLSQRRARRSSRSAALTS